MLTLDRLGDKSAAGAEAVQRGWCDVLEPTELIHMRDQRRLLQYFAGLCAAPFPHVPSASSQ
jgi:hypothetical protein